MRYHPKSVGSQLASKLLGTYEKEINKFTEKIIQRRPERIINVGAAEGYYAVGFAMRSLNSRVMAFEGQTEGRTLIQRNGELNQVADRIDIQGYCDSEMFQRALTSCAAPVVIMDVEGFEKELLDPEKFPALFRAIILVEVHVAEEIQMESILEGRFRGSHNIEREPIRSFAPTDIAPALLKKISFLPAAIILKAIDEQRSDKGSWFFMRPKG